MQVPTPMLAKSPEALQSGRSRSRGLHHQRLPQNCAPLLTGRLDSWTLRKVLYLFPHWPGLNINWRMKSSLTGKYHVQSLHSWEQLLAQVKKLDVPISRWVKLHGLLSHFLSSVVNKGSIHKGTPRSSGGMDIAEGIPCCLLSKSQSHTACCDHLGPFHILGSWVRRRGGICLPCLIATFHLRYHWSHSILVCS